MSSFVTPVASWGGGFFFNLTSIFTGVIRIELSGSATVTQKTVSMFGQFDL